MGRCMGCMEEIEEQLNICPYCNYMKETPPREAYHMAAGFHLHSRYTIGRVLGFGGFGVTYIGYDETLGRKIAIKEFLPSTYATRMPGDTQITVYGGEATEQFKAGLDRFVDEAKRLAGFNGVDGIVDIYDTFVENNTAYIVMEYLQGIDVKELLNANGVMPYEEALEIILKVCDALEPVHREGIIHRDISPDNIFITFDGKIKLLDFGASRYATSVNSKSLSVILKSGYAPEEQYRSRGNQGSWSDVYALAATFYKMITGITPEDSMERAINDELKAPSKLGVSILQSAENAIMNALNVKTEFRTKSVMEFRNALCGEKTDRVKEKKGKNDVGRLSTRGKVFVTVILAAVLIMGLLTVTGIIGGNNYLEDTFGSAVEEGYTNTPGVVNLTEEKAKKAINKANLEYLVVGKEYSDKIEKGKILSQEPLPGRVAMEGSTLEVIISGGSMEEAMNTEDRNLIDLTYMPIDEAAVELNGCGYGYEIQYEYSDDIAEGLVISYETEESYARLVVSLGKAQESFEIRAAYVHADSGGLRFHAVIDTKKTYDECTEKENRIYYRVSISLDEGKSYVPLTCSEIYTEGETVYGNSLQTVSFSLTEIIANENIQYLDQEFLLKVEQYNPYAKDSDEEEFDSQDYLWDSVILTPKYKITQEKDIVEASKVEVLTWEQMEELSKQDQLDERMESWVNSDSEYREESRPIRISGNFEKGKRYYASTYMNDIAYCYDPFWCESDGCIYLTEYYDYEEYSDDELYYYVIAEASDSYLDMNDTLVCVTHPYNYIFAKAGGMLCNIQGVDRLQAEEQIEQIAGKAPNDFYISGYEYSNQYEKNTITRYQIYTSDKGIDIEVYMSLGNLEETESTQSEYGHIVNAKTNISNNFGAQIDIIVDGISTTDQDATTCFKVLYSTDGGISYNKIIGRSEDGEEYEFSNGYYNLCQDNSDGRDEYSIDFGIDYIPIFEAVNQQKIIFKIQRYVDTYKDEGYEEWLEEEYLVNGSITYKFQDQINITNIKNIDYSQLKQTFDQGKLNDNKEIVYLVEAVEGNYSEYTTGSKIYMLEGNFKKGVDYYSMSSNTVDTSQCFTCCEDGVLYVYLSKNELEYEDGKYLKDRKIIGRQNKFVTDEDIVITCTGITIMDF